LCGEPRIRPHGESHEQTAKGEGNILSAAMMDSLYPQRQTNQSYKNSVGAASNLGVDETADVLHAFFLNVVSEE
jgi:hypothetical protein